MQANLRELAKKAKWSYSPETSKAISFRKLKSKSCLEKFSVEMEALCEWAENQRWTRALEKESLNSWKGSTDGDTRKGRVSNGKRN